MGSETTRTAPNFDLCSNCNRYHGDVPCNPAPSDPWKHRSSGMKCDTCMWFVGKPPDHGVGTLGRCRRHAPTMNGYPAVTTTDWCGDHKLCENKVAR